MWSSDLLWKHQYYSIVHWCINMAGALLYYILCGIKHNMCENLAKDLCCSGHVIMYMYMTLVCPCYYVCLFFAFFFESGVPTLFSMSRLLGYLIASISSAKASLIMKTH